MDNGDGTWSYATEPGFDPEALEVFGPLTWRYVEQARYAWDPEPITGPLSYVYQGDEKETVEQQLLGTRRHDRTGRMWEVVAVDTASLPAVADTEEPVLGEPAGVQVGDPAPAIGELITWTPLSWYYYDCESPYGNSSGYDDEDDCFILDADDRNTITNPTPVRQSTVVKVNAGASVCSGIVLRDLWVLTAEHCVYTSSGTLIQAGSISIVNQYSGDTVMGDEYFPGGWDPASPDPDLDYGLIKLQSAFSPDPGDMDLSSAVDSTLKNVGANFHNLGYGLRKPCSGCNGNSSMLHSANNNVTGFFNKTLRWEGDVGQGQSGGPLYYCPHGSSISTCEVDEDGFVVAVVSGWNNVWNRFVGPRASNFHMWATDIMDTQ